ncbi:MAG: aminopeptidase P family protein [Bacteroidetes bacterium]|nr:MAG: aminopeptidase P family protein [Bacteroidota bacterium]RLD87306.1 MAG: aminopeptidase P family protein [Bacteroidota bacterium]
MFKKEVYTDRRNRLKKEVGSGIAFFPGNVEAAFNYPANQYHFRQDSHFLYFFGIDLPGFAAVIDFDNGKEYIFGNDFDIDDIIWMGPQPKVAELAAQAGITETGTLAELVNLMDKVLSEGRKVHYLPPYRGETDIQIADLLHINIADVRKQASSELIRAVVKLKEVKDEYEIAEIEKAVDIAYKMHTTAMKMAKPGVVEQEIAGTIEGISLALGGPVSFPIILSMDVQTLHNHYHGNVLEEGRMMVTDAGAETQMHYASDITRTVPVGGKFSQRQAGIYQTVLNANVNAIEAIKPGVKYRDIHFLAAKTIVNGLKEIGLMKGDTDAAVKSGAHTLFMPHGLGHMMGMDVHDMEGLGEDYVGYDEHTERSKEFGTAYLRLAKELKPGFVLTVEPGIYFIPELIDQFRTEGRFADFINYDLVETYKDFGGVRIEDDILVTETGYKVLGKPIPKTIEEVEKTMAEPL